MLLDADQIGQHLFYMTLRMNGRTMAGGMIVCAPPPALSVSEHVMPLPSVVVGSLVVPNTPATVVV